ncbi:ATP-dependent DNA helicase RecG [Angustibacter sp. McL0619]|uniref:ATP-dependent DNA helicase RecG n=1 Tax=Angustibacter sp. McL0619 TaxID=3415676 RepID=UPI003CF5E2E1
MNELDVPVGRRVGAKAATALEKQFGIRTVGQLLRHYPRRYVERGERTDLSSLRLDEHVTVLAEVLEVRVHSMKSRPGARVQVRIGDGRGTLDLVFFAAKKWSAQKFERELAVGTVGLFSGRVGLYQSRRQLAHPVFDVLPDADEDAAQALAEKPIPIYPAGAGIQSWQVRNAISPIVTTLPPLPDPLPDELRARRGLLGIDEAIRAVHDPATIEDAMAARARLTFEEAFVLQSALLRRRAALAELAATPRLARPDGLLARFDERLPFELTRGQRAVGEQLTTDLAGASPMHRLLQGEVGSGKTLVALRAMLTVVDAGGQAALLAPTEVLAVQHNRSITTMLGDLAEAGMLGGGDVATRVALLTGSQPAAVRRRMLLQAASGEAAIVIGTHALLQEHVQFADLGLVVVDEQHRFGVEQRDALRAKGSVPPHLLVMTATPIPRTVAMTVFGDLETSTLEELPPGRSPVVTHVVPGDNPAWMSRTWQRVREEVDAGRQAFVVCPRIGGDDASADDGLEPTVPDEDGLRRPPLAVLDVIDGLRAEPALIGLRVELLHGRLPVEEREATMAAFTAGEVDVLVATTVVEVGVDVPNATTMVVLDADRFGISQLHQLRGRIGRGQAAGLALLVTEASPDSPARERLDAVASTTDGFALSRIDLEQRREGDVLGAAQSGFRSSLRLLRVLRDEELIVQARQEAAAVVDADPHLSDHAALAAAIDELVGGDREDYLERG